MCVYIYIYNILSVLLALHRRFTSDLPTYYCRHQISGDLDARVLSTQWDDP